MFRLESDIHASATHSVHKNNERPQELITGILAFEEFQDGYHSWELIGLDWEDGVE